MNKTPIDLRATRGAPFVVAILAALPIAMIAMVPDNTMIIVGVAFAAGVLAVAISLLFRRLIVDDRGVTTKSVFGSRTIAWDDIVGYRFWSYELKTRGGQSAAVGLAASAIEVLERGRLGGRGGAHRRFGTGMGSGQLTLIARDRRRIVVDGRYRDVVTAVDRIFAEIHPRLRAAEQHDYAPFAFDGAQLSYRGKRAVTLDEIEWVTVDNDRLAIRRRGATFSWARASMKRVNNGLLLLEELGQRGVRVETSASVFLPRLDGDVAMQSAPRSRARTPLSSPHDLRQ